MDGITIPSYTYFSGQAHDLQQLRAIQLLDGKDNVSIGLSAGQNEENGTNNVFLGSYSGGNAIADSSVMVGTLAGSESYSIRGSCFMGYRAGQRSNYINQSVCIGPYSGQQMIRATDNVLLGYQTGANITSGSRNVGIGSYAAFTQYNASDNIMIGYNAGYRNTLGSNNCYIGSSSGFAAFDGEQNVCLGVSSGEQLYRGIKNVLLGYRAGASIQDASNCIAIGTRAMEFFYDGDTNTCLGTEAAQYLTGDNNTIIGGYSTANATGNFNTIIGSRSMNRRALDQVNLSNCVVIGENIQFRIPVRQVSVVITDFDSVPDAHRTSEQTDLVVFQDLDEQFGNCRAFTLINTVPIGDPVPQPGQRLMIGPWTLDTSQPGRYTLRFGGDIDVTNTLLPTVPVVLDVSVTFQQIDIVLVVYGDTLHSTTLPSAPTMDVWLERTSTEITLSINEQIDTYAFDSLYEVVVYSDGVLGLSNVSSLVDSGHLVLGMEVDVPYQGISNVFRVTDIDVENGYVFVTPPVPIESGKRVVLSRVLTVNVTVQENRIEAPSLSSMVWQDGAAYVSQSSDPSRIPVGVYPLLRVRAGVFELGVADLPDGVSLTMHVGMFERSLYAFEVVTEGPSKNIQGLRIEFSQRADTERIIKDVSGPTRYDGHVHAGEGTQELMDVNIDQNVLEFPADGYAEARYRVDALPTSVFVQNAFTMHDGVPFGLVWFDAYTLTLTPNAEDVGVQVTYAMGGETKTFANVSQTTIEVQGDVLEYTSIPWSDGDLLTMMVDHVLDTKSLRINVWIRNTLYLSLQLPDVPRVNEFSQSLVFFANGSTIFSNMVYSIEGFTAFPSFSDTLVLGSNFTLGGEDIESERSNVMVIGLDNQRLVRSDIDTTRLYSNTVIMNTVVCTGYYDTDMPTVVVYPTTYTGNAVDVTGHTVLDTLDTRGDYYAMGNIWCDRNAHVEGNITVGNSVIVGGDVDVSGDIIGRSNAFIESIVVVGGNTYMESNAFVTDNLSVGGDEIVEGDSIVFGDMLGQSNLEVSGEIFGYSNVFVSNQLTVEANVYAYANLEVSLDAYIYGNETVYGSLRVEWDANIRGYLTVGESVFVEGNAFIDEECIVSGNTYMESNAIVDDVLYVSGNVYGYSNAHVYDDTYLYSNAFITGNMHTYSNGHVYEETYLYANAFITGNMYTYSNAHVDHDMYIYGNAYIWDDTYMYSDAYVSGEAYITGDTYMYSDAYVSGEAYITGDTYMYSDAYVYSNLYVYENVIVTNNVTGFSADFTYGNITYLTGTSADFVTPGQEGYVQTDSVFATWVYADVGEFQTDSQDGYVQADEVYATTVYASTVDTTVLTNSTGTLLCQGDFQMQNSTPGITNGGGRLYLNPFDATGGQQGAYFAVVTADTFRLATYGESDAFGQLIYRVDARTHFETVADHARRIGILESDMYIAQQQIDYLVGAVSSLSSAVSSLSTQ